MPVLSTFVSGAQIHDQPATGDDRGDEAVQQVAAGSGVDRAGDGDADGTIREPSALDGEGSESLWRHLRPVHRS